ncbi:MAG: methionyl-tRNA formyltransferase, partial [Actinomycetota bacterium]
RAGEPSASPVKRAAVEAGLDVYQPQRVRDPEFEQLLRELNPEVAVVVAYGKILPAGVLRVPRSGFVNVHFSLLPVYRGAAPVQRALIDGVDKTGVSLIVLTEGMDEGPILATCAAKVAEDDTAGRLGARLARLGAELLVPTLNAYAKGGIRPIEQDHARATYAPKVTTEEARIDWSRRGSEIRNLVRGCNPEPGAWTTFRGRRVKVLFVEPASGEPAMGEVDASGRVGTGEGALFLSEVQMAGKRAMSGTEMLRGLRPAPGEHFE